MNTKLTLPLYPYKKDHHIKNDNMVFDNRTGERALNIRELSEKIGFKTRTIYNWNTREPDFPYIKWGKSVRYNLEAVLRWLENRR